MGNRGGMPGWLGFPLIGLGVLMVWAGFNGVALTDVIASVLQGKPLPGTKGTTVPAVADSATVGSSGLVDSSSGGRGAR